MYLTVCVCTNTQGVSSHEQQQPFSRGSAPGSRQHPRLGEGGHGAPAQPGSSHRGPHRIQARGPVHRDEARGPVHRGEARGPAHRGEARGPTDAGDPCAATVVRQAVARRQADGAGHQRARPAAPGDGGGTRRRLQAVLQEGIGEQADSRSEVPRSAHRQAVEHGDCRHARRSHQAARAEGAQGGLRGTDGFAGGPDQASVRLHGPRDPAHRGRHSPPEALAGAEGRGEGTAE